MGALLALSLLAGPPTEAPPSPAPHHLDGTWQLDAAASDPLDGILKALGYGWIARRIMRALAVKQILKGSSKGLSVRVVTRFSDDTIVLPCDGKWAPGRTLDGGQTRRRSRWLQGQSALRTEDRFDHGLLTTTRRLIKADIFHEILSFEESGKATLRATRVFRRQ